MLYKGKVTNAKTGIGIAGIRVTDGFDICITNERGEYAFEGNEKSNVLCVSALTKRHDDWFKYTGGKGGEYNFAIDPVKEKDQAVFMHVADSEIEGREDVSSLLAIMSESVKKSGADFFVHTGDICRADGLRRHYKVTPNEKVGCPMRYCIGNHDYCDGDYGEQLYEKLYGPTWYSFDFAGIHFVFLSIGKGEFPSGYNKSDQWKWLERDLELKSAATPFVVFQHDSCYDEREFIIELEDICLDLKKHGLIAWVCGHFHHNYAQNINGIYSICTTTPDFGGIDSSAAGVRETRIRGNEISSVMHYLRYPLGDADAPIMRVKLSGMCEFCDPVIDGDYVYAATSSDDLRGECGVYCINKNSGDIKWFTKIECGFKSALTIYGDIIYAVSSNAVLYLIDKNTGSVVKAVDTMIKKPIYARLSPTVADGVVFAGRHNQICGFDAKTAEKLWERRTVKGGAASVSKAVFDKQSAKHYVSILWKELIEIDAKTGDAVTLIKADGNSTASGTPTLDGDYIYSAGYTMVSKSEKDTGKTLILKDIDSQVDTVGGPTVDGEVLYFPTAQRGVAALDKNTLELLKVFPCDTAGVITTPYIMGSVNAVETRPIIDGVKLIFAASDGNIWVYNKHTAELIKVIKTASPILAQPIYDGKYIYVACFDGELLKYEI